MQHSIYLTSPYGEIIVLNYSTIRLSKMRAHNFSVTLIWFENYSLINFKIFSINIFVVQIPCFLCLSTYISLCITLLMEFFLHLTNKTDYTLMIIFEHIK